MANRFKLVLCEDTNYHDSYRTEEWSGGRLTTSSRHNAEPCGIGGITQIWVDTATNVQYLWHYSSPGNSSGFTVLLGPDGKPLLYRP